MYSAQLEAARERLSAVGPAATEPPVIELRHLQQVRAWGLSHAIGCRVVTAVIQVDPVRMSFCRFIAFLSWAHRLVCSQFDLLVDCLFDLALFWSSQSNGLLRC